MGLVTSALQIGRSALLAYQSALHVVGNNISNAGSASYTRQSPILSPIIGVHLPQGLLPGAGVQLTELRRNVDEALESRLRTAIADQESALVEQSTLGRIESLLNELSDYDLSTLLNDFFNAWRDLQNMPHDISARGVVLTKGQALAESLQRMRRDLLAQHAELNERLSAAADRADELAAQIAELNQQIVEAEAAGGGLAGSLRDQRQAILQELSRIVEIQIRPQSSGAVNVYVGNDPLVQYGMSRGLETTQQIVDGVMTVTVRFADDNSPVEIRGGQMEGIINSRQQHVLEQVDGLDQLAAALIQDVNRLHAEGQGLIGLTNLVSTYDVLDPAAALNTAEAGLDLTPVNGSFLITVRDASGVAQTSQIDVDLDGIGSDMSLNDLAGALDAIAGISASVRADGRLQIDAEAGSSFTFSEDSSGVLAGLGLNTFFVGRDASDIAVNDVLSASPELLAAAMEFLPGDGSNAGRIAALASQDSVTLGSGSLLDFYGGIVGRVAVNAQAASTAVEAADVIVGSLQAQRESVSGVNLDEEAIQLMKLERAFQGAARYVAVVDELISELIGLVR